LSFVPGKVWIESHLFVPTRSIVHVLYQPVHNARVIIGRQEKKDILMRGLLLAASESEDRMHRSLFRCAYAIDSKVVLPGTPLYWQERITA